MAQGTFSFFEPEPRTPARQELESAPGAYAEFAVEVPLRRSFTYHVPPDWRERVQPGARVEVPFGGQSKVGYYLRALPLTEVRALAENGVRIRSAVRLLDEQPLLDNVLVMVARWMADHYRCSLGEALAAMLPAGVKRRQSAERVRLAVLAVSREEAQTVADELETRRQHRSPRQAMLLKALVQLGGRARVRDLLLEAAASRDQLQALARKGLVVMEEELAESDPLAGYISTSASAPPPDVTLTAHQRQALQRIERDIQRRRHALHVLHGVTGSGKTEVYLRAIATTLERQRTAIVLVPEISLTPQTAERFRVRFGRVALLHSHLTDGQRADAWHHIARGEVDVVIGARSALFAPLPRLGLIVIDEEHETSYKQDCAPRYHARDVARLRARLGDAVLVLGSATPALESMHLAMKGDASVLPMPERVEGRAMPPVEIVDMRVECRKRYTVLSQRLRSEIRRVLERREQVILFLNRRGFATFLLCPRCGYVRKCELCDVPMTFHRREKRLVCHYCDGQEQAPKDCPDCGKPGILYLGSGTERIEELIQAEFPQARLERMDSDTMRDRTGYARVLGAFKRGEIDMLVGTQMIAKGLDFPNVTLVGIIKADMALNMADFRASERTFQLIAQVAGRTGRGDKGGRVVVQTFMPDHASVRAAAAHDYMQFAAAELKHRKEWRYPPFVHLARVIFRGEELDHVTARAEAVHEGLQKQVGRTAGQATLLPPAPCPIQVLKGMHRMHLLLRASTAAMLSEILNRTEELDATVHGVQIAVDVDPVSML